MTMPGSDRHAATAAREEATAPCRRSLEQNPANAEILTNLAVCVQLSGRYDRATEYLERASADPRPGV